MRARWRTARNWLAVPSCCLCYVHSLYSRSRLKCVFYADRPRHNVFETFEATLFVIIYVAIPTSSYIYSVYIALHTHDHRPHGWIYKRLSFSLFFLLFLSFSFLLTRTNLCRVSAKVDCWFVCISTFYRLNVVIDILALKRVRIIRSPWTIPWKCLKKTFIRAFLTKCSLTHACLQFHTVDDNDTDARDGSR